MLAPSLTLGDENPGFVTGSVALTAFPIGPSSSSLGGASILNGSSVSGSITVLNSGVKVSLSGGSQVNQGVVNDPINLGVSASDAIARSKYYASLPATINPATLPNLNNAPVPKVPKNQIPYHLGTLTIVGAAGINVVNLSALKVKDQDVVIQAPAGATFIINVAGTVDMQNANLLVAGGIDERQVLVNVVPSSGTNAGSVTLKSEDDAAGDPLVQFEGSLLAPQSSQVNVETTIIHGVIASGSALDLREKTGVMGHCPSSTTTAR